MKNVQPPLGNTGAQNTQKIGLRSLVDWVSFTLPPLTSHFTNLRDFVKIFGLDLDDFNKYKWGLEGYSSHYELGGIKIYYDYSMDNPYWFDISGKGCRFYESLDLLTWQDFIKRIIDFKANITRIDLAIDDFKGYIDLNKVQWAVDNGTCRSLFESARPMLKRSLKDGSKLGHTIYFGSGQSRLQVRFYDKKLERLAMGKELEDWVKHWVRIELQFRKERAQAISEMLAKNDDVGYFIKGTLSKYINFCVKENDSNKSRWKLVSWWSEFLGSVDKLKLTYSAPDATIERSLEWLDGQVSSSLAMILKAVDGNMDIIYDLIKKGESKLTKKHFAMLNDFEKMKNKKVPEKNNSDTLSPYDYL